MLNIEEQERAAYIAGDATTATLLARVQDLERVIERAAQMLAITDTPGVNDDVIELLEGALV